MEFVAVGCCTGKCLRLYQIITNLTSGDTCGDSTGSNRIEKDQTRISLRPI